MISLSELANKLKSQKKVALVSHVRPDGDTIGSALALKKALYSLGIGAEVVCDDTVPSRFFFLKEADEIKKELDGEFSAIVAIDCADVTRLGKFAETFLSHKNTFVIDHHETNPRYAKYNYVRDLASNAENVFELINAMGVEIDERIANLLAMGIMTDTGNFRHKNVKENTFHVAGELVGKGANVNEIYFHMFSAQSKERAKLFGKVMSKIRYFHDNKLAIATARLIDIEESGAEQNETDGFIDFIMGIIGVEIGAMIMEVAPNKFKVSLRAKNADVSAVASSFGGGGHKLASGCQIPGEYEEVVDRLTFACSRELPE